MDARSALNPKCYTESASHETPVGHEPRIVGRPSEMLDWRAWKEHYR